jgi:hypothetical protein
LVFSSVLVVGLNSPQIAHASSLPGYNYTQSFDTTPGGSAYPYQIATDSNDNTYVVGTFAGSVNFAGSQGSDIQTDANGSATDGFITKYNAQGVYQWTRTLKLVGASDGYITGVAVDSNNNVYYTGQFTGTVTFDSKNNTNTISTSNQNGFITRINADGSYGYTKIFDPETNNGNGLYVGPTGIAVQGSDVYVTGNFDGSVNFNNAGSDVQTDPAVNADLFFTEFSTSGIYSHTQIMDNSPGVDSYANPSGITLDSQGNVYLTGGFQGTVNFAGNKGSDDQTQPGNSNESFVTKFNSNGSYGFTRIFDSSSGSISSDSIAVDSLGNIYVSGYFSSTITFDGIGGSDTKTSVNGSDFLTKYNSSGTYDFTKVFNTDAGSGVDYGGYVAVDSENNVYITSSYYGTVNFNPSGGGDVQTAPNNDYDAAVTKFSSNGAYDWTVGFDPTTGNINYDGTSPVATNSLGQVLLAGTLYNGSAIFDYLNDTDVHTDVNGSGAVFLTSLQSYAPASTSTSSTNDPVSTPSAPNTGFGESVNNIATVTLGISSFVLFSIGLVLYHRNKIKAEQLQ